MCKFFKFRDLFFEYELRQAPDYRHDQEPEARHIEHIGFFVDVLDDDGSDSVGIHHERLGKLQSLSHGGGNEPGFDRDDVYADLEQAGSQPFAKVVTAAFAAP